MCADIEAECQDDYMKIRIGFNGSFAGLLYSSGIPIGKHISHKTHTLMQSHWFLRYKQFKCLVPLWQTVVYYLHVCWHV